MKKLLICLMALLLCVPAWAETAADPLAGAEIPVFDPDSAPRFSLSGEDAEAFIACAKALWETPLFFQDTAGAAWRAEWDEDEYPAAGYSVYAELPGEDFLYVFFALDGHILHLNVNREAFYAPDREDFNLSGKEYAPEELRGREDLSAEEKLLAYFLDFAEAFEPETRGKILTVSTGACSLVSGTLHVEIWAETPDVPGADKPGCNERHMEVQVLPEFKVLNYGPGRG